ncbi:MAG: SAM-dependent methyltransferase [Alphaproteobacteria bacterium]|nr:SAM-dependent methyltransferase [Alphaproteobacteria bacterium]
MNALEKIIHGIIAKQGAISLAAFMELALQHPEYGYYRVREPIGRKGDFVTAPEVSQMFGEMVGVWCAESWRGFGKPDPFALIELGPGRGTMMQDIMRATANVGGFHAAKQLYLLDSDRALRAAQEEKLGGDAPHYIDAIAALPPLPSLIVANEFFDALPVRQFEKTFRGWAEHMVTVANGELVMTQRPLEEAELVLIPAAMRDVNPGVIFEISPKAQNIMRDLAKHLAAHKGAMLIVDYGYTAASGDASVQAVSSHASVSIFERPGEVDLTAHVDFAVLGQAASAAGAEASPVITQGEFLKNLGIEIRADTLKRRVPLPQAAAIDADLHRLIDDSKMGSLFKVMEVRCG